MAAIDLPPVVKDLVLCVDADGDQEALAKTIEKARAFHAARGRRVLIARPPAGMDFNDMLRGGLKYECGRLHRRGNAVSRRLHGNPIRNQVVDHVISDRALRGRIAAAIGRIKRTDGRGMIKDFGFEVNAGRADIASAVVEAASGWAVLFCLAEGVRAWRDDLQAAGRNGTPRLHGLSPTPPLDSIARERARGFECMITCWCGPGHRKWNGRGVVECSRIR